MFIKRFFSLSLACLLLAGLTLTPTPSHSGPVLKFLKFLTGCSKKKEHHRPIRSQQRRPIDSAAAGLSGAAALGTGVVVLGSFVKDLNASQEAKRDSKEHCEGLGIDIENCSGFFTGTATLSECGGEYSKAVVIAKNRAINNALLATDADVDVKFTIESDMGKLSEDSIITASEGKIKKIFVISSNFRDASGSIVEVVIRAVF